MSAFCINDVKYINNSKRHFFKSVIFQILRMFTKSLLILSIFFCNFFCPKCTETLQMYATGVPQGFTLSPILFNVFLIDLCLVIVDKDFTNYTDDNTIYCEGDSIDNFILPLQDSTKNVFQWICDSRMQRNAGKYHLLFSKNDEAQLEVRDSFIKNNTSEKLLGVKIDNKLSFDKHVKILINKKGNSKLRALAIATSYLLIGKWKLPLNTFFSAQFNYCPLIPMLHSRCNNNKFKYLHKRCFQFVYNDKPSSFRELVQKDGSVSIRQKSIQKLAPEMFKSKHTFAPKTVEDIFVKSNENHYNS